MYAHIFTLNSCVLVVTEYDKGNECPSGHISVQLRGCFGGFFRFIITITKEYIIKVFRILDPTGKRRK